MPLLGALLLLLALALGAALVPAGLSLDRRISDEIRQAAVEDLGRAPMVLEDRNAAREEALSMHAEVLAGTESLRQALEAGAHEEAARIARETTAPWGEDPVLILPDGTPIVGPALPEETLRMLREGGRGVTYLFDDMPRAIGVVPLGDERTWLGAAGSAMPFHTATATSLAALARADVTIVSPDRRMVASTLPEDSARALVAAAVTQPGVPETEKVRAIDVRGAAVWVARGPLSGAGEVLFTRSVDQELAALPALRRGALVAGGLALVLALGSGLLVSVLMTRPVAGLVTAADRVARGDFDAPVPSSRVRELDRLGAAFRSMRDSLEVRLVELAEANRELEARQDRLQELQAELIQRDRVASSARMAAELAHEIRNPVANVRNCLEVVRRGLPEGSEGSRFADMAIDELLRMHEMAEHLLDLNRPVSATGGTADLAVVAREVATLAGVGEDRVPVRLEVSEPELHATIGPDALKQILFNLVENAAEAASSQAEVTLRVLADEGRAVVEVLDRGPGIPDEILGQVFDPFFTTKEAVTGVGLGLSVAEGLARRHGGRLEASHREGGGARVRVELPRAAAGR